MSTPILPFAVWASGTNQASIPANDNSLRNQILNGLVISDAVTAQPGSPTAGDIYILAATHTGTQWAGFDEDDLVIFSGGTWYAFAPVEGVVVNLDGTLRQFITGAWADAGTGGGGSTALPWFDVTDVAYGAAGDGRVLADVGTTNADATVTSATGAFTNADIGKVFEVTNNTTVFRSTILSINSGTSIELAANVTFTATGCTAHFGSDDTPEIQAAIDAAIAAGGGEVFFPHGMYIVNGALQDTSRSNSQLLLPRIHTTTGKPITVTLRGEAAAPPIPSVAAAVVIPSGGSLLKCTLNTTGGTSPACIGGWGPAGSAADFSNAHVVIKDLGVRMPVNAVLTAIDLSHMACAEIDGVLIDAGEYHIQNITEPSTTSSYGVVMPKQSNGAHSVIGSCDVIGMYYGYQFAEHSNGVNVNAWGCKRAFEFAGATDHASVFQRMMAVHCEQVLVAGAGAHRVSIAQLDIEHATSGWWVTDFDINDASNRLTGDVKWHVVLAGTGSDPTFTISGASNIRRKRVGTDAVFALTDAANIATNCNRGTNFRVVLGGNRTLDNPTALQDGEVYNWRVHQDGTGSRTLAYGSKFKFAGGTPTLSTAASAKDFISCQYDATDDTLYCAIAKSMG